MRSVASNPSQANKRTPSVRLSLAVSLHPATITIHGIIWGKRVLAVPHDTSERPADYHS
jgi:hypothetical protein